MKNEKQELIFKLLKEGKIDEKEAVLLMQTEKEYVYIPSNTNPWYQPYYTTNQITVSSNSDDYFICNDFDCSIKMN